ncbi:unnamed protein product [Oikopleura dioica]|uniref:CUB domain-containing protein n=1 Tax=Oikopleura dioica TaxID=34765 RepID=E4X184_OIKDI|nr:unnamed protein product [Oikopleura dioica]CBY36097.1 unnamed protein product [Oikopleura dioica]
MRRVGFIILGAFAEQNVCKQSTAAEHIDIDSLYQHDITCGGALPNRGRLEGPVLPHRDEYPSLCDCTWTIGGDFENEFATIWLNFLHFKIDHSAGHCTNDFVEIYSSGGESRVIDPICGDTLPESINRRVQLPVIIKFKSDEDVEHSSGFKIEYSVVPDDSSVEELQTGEIRTGSAPETKKSSAPTGLIIGLLLIAIVSDS